MTMTIIRYQNPVCGNESLIALSGDVHYIELAVIKAQARIAEQGIAAYERRMKEQAEGMHHDPGQIIDGFPDWIGIYQEELAKEGIQSVPCIGLQYETRPFEMFDREMKLRGLTL